MGDPTGGYSPQRWADRLVGDLDPGVRTAFAADPKAAVIEHFGLRLQPEQHLGERRGDGGWCDGVSLTKAGVILYAPTMSRRENFTIAHEVGHHLIDEDDDETTWDWWADHPQRGRITEQTCEAIASRLLLPRDQVRALLGNGRPSGTALQRLFAESKASREACAIALAERLGCEGFVALVKADTATVTFASSFGDTKPTPWRDDTLPTAHPLRRLNDGETQIVESWWPSQYGNKRSY
jgi:hypothetical protein